MPDLLFELAPAAGLEPAIQRLTGGRLAGNQLIGLLPLSGPGLILEFDRVKCPLMADSGHLL